MSVQFYKAFKGLKTYLTVELLKEGRLVTKASWKGFKFLKTSSDRIFGYEAETGKCSLSFVPVRSELDAKDWIEYDGPASIPPKPILSEARINTVNYHEAHNVY